MVLKFDSDTEFFAALDELEKAHGEVAVCSLSAADLDLFTYTFRDGTRVQMRLTHPEQAPPQ